MTKDLVVHNEARAEFLKGTNKCGILIIHGFTGSTQSMRLYGYALNEKGFTVLMPRLSGHGTTPEDMEQTTYLEWIKDVETAYYQLASEVDNVFVAGLSMGGSLTLYLAENYPIKAIATINAASMNLPAFESIFQDDNSPDFIKGIGSDIKKEGIKEWAYSKTPKKSIGEILKLEKILDENLSKITTPTIIFSSNEDHVVPPPHSQNIYDKISSKTKKLIHLENSYHVATLDNDLAIIVEETNHFFHQYI
ncbi:alpha/beta hydrolase [Rhizosphaericola mali]|uniref:Alpha/beta fold hydrolase n=1 Tax=Rhizosphaericola mali TaxID=2545455 RepID=A0A5P2GA32_9BACT|nr:alpha/beta fold hydrolase [Rhizosphaericola mali]QES90053.1 alpha/beta fold hydrolase [Rhizosphaericola mali]